jgi:hypothetical protein
MRIWSFFSFPFFFLEMLSSFASCTFRRVTYFNGLASERASGQTPSTLSSRVTNPDNRFSYPHIPALLHRQEKIPSSFPRQFLTTTPPPRSRSNIPAHTEDSNSLKNINTPPFTHAHLTRLHHGPKCFEESRDVVVPEARLALIWIFA